MAAPAGNQSAEKGEGARPGPDDKVSTGNFLGIGLRTDDFGDN